MDCNREESKKMYEKAISINKYNGAIIINYATLCTKQDEYENAIRLLSNVINNIDDFQFQSDEILGEKYPHTIPTSFWKYTSILLIKNLYSKLNNKEDVIINQYGLDIKYYMPVLMNFMYLYSDGSFKPEKTVTKAEFINIAFSIMQELGISPKKIESRKDIGEFKDISGHWCERHIRIALRIGILDLNYEELFYPDNQIIGEEAVDILQKLYI